LLIPIRSAKKIRFSFAISKQIHTFAPNPKFFNFFPKFLINFTNYVLKPGLYIKQEIFNNGLYKTSKISI